MFLMTFKDECERRNIKILKDDINFIKNILIKVPQKLHKSVINDYLNLWYDAMGKTNKSQYAQNMGRFAANSWLRNKYLNYTGIKYD